MELGNMMRNRGAQALFEYWHTTKGGASAPKRRDIEPRGMKSVLPWVFILERIDRDLTPFRLAGTGICAQNEQELAGTNFLSLWLGDCRRTMRSLMDNVALMPSPALIEFETKTRNMGRTSGEILLLPLRDDDGKVHQILGGWFNGVGADHNFELPLVHNKITNIHFLTENEPAFATIRGQIARQTEGSPIRLVVSNNR